MELTTVQVIGDVSGPGRLNRALPLVIRSARANRVVLKAVGIVRDADSTPAGRLQSAQDILRANMLVAPVAHAAFLPGEPAVGLFICPDGVSEGAIEAICWAAVSGEPQSPCVSEYVRCLEEAGALRSANIDKTRTHAFLAAMDDPVARVGEGAKQGCWPLNHAAFASLRAFISRLAEI